ncbi:TatD family nuclease-associated radical SAM protein [Shewanella inventionis]|uniref:TatD family nuclease-associated radical SAM protein n=1 Tax=Shewanella inventionis TaxID=1738770 RepID=UPI001668ABD5|nr:TatD family nuclease-associated radical SAM protein [Shewanella inventionis]MCL1158480.1 TatD family nuclease-associated radical SAM protein [Shewanella inventionis]UAL42981.1 TatD family nuclease-associated radical SAM protein [Shewanella inventionis]
MTEISSTSPTLVYDIGKHRYLNITARCTLRCQFCPKHNGSKQVHDYDLSLNKSITAMDIIPLLGDVKEVEEYVFCGFGEPTLNLDCLLQVAHAIKAQGGRVRLNTDGLGNLFHRRNILPQLSQCIDSLSISLNADTPEGYQRHCRPKLAHSYEALLEFIHQAPQFIKEVQVSAINGLADVDIARCMVIAEKNGCQFKQRELDKIG